MDNYGESSPLFFLLIFQEDQNLILDSVTSCDTRPWGARRLDAVEDPSKGANHTTDYDHPSKTNNGLFPASLASPEYMSMLGTVHAGTHWRSKWGCRRRDLRKGIC
jgi:hypothetical protein